MPAPMQISLEEIISMLLQRVEALSASDENSKTKQNIIYRALYKKGLITEEDILDSVKEEYRMLKELGVIQDEPSDDMYKTITDGILQWIKGDVEGIKNVCLSLPTVLGKRGVHNVVTPVLNDEERKQLADSAKVMKEYSDKALEMISVK